MQAALSPRPNPSADARREGAARGARYPAAPPTAVNEKARRQLVRVVMIIYLLAIFEGALRKWVLPQFSLYIFFIRDPFVVYAYALATVHGLWPRRHFFLRVSWGMAAFGVVLASAQMAVGEFSDARAMLAVYGWRNYFLYVPLAFLIGAQFRGTDLDRLCRWTLFLSIPIAALVGAQFFAPINSAINVGLAADKSLQFHGLGLTGEHTRPMGTFSSGAGQIQFVASAFAILFAMIIAARRKQASRWLLLIVSGGAVLTCAALSGSRGTISHCALIAMSAMTLGLIGRGAALKARALTIPLTVVTIALVVMPIVFPQAIDAFLARWESAKNAEQVHFDIPVVGRALYGFIDFTRLLADTPVLGYGLGFGGNASTTLGAKIDGKVPLSMAETDWARHIIDLGPVFGLVYIALRVALTAWMIRTVWRATRRGAGPLPFLLLGYEAYVLLLGQITGQGAINAYAWLFLGFCMAASATRPASAAPPQVVPTTANRTPPLPRMIIPGQRAQA